MAGTAAMSSSSSSSPCITFIAESMILPTRNIRLFAPIFLLIFCHTFIFLGITAIHVNPLAPSLDSIHSLATGVLVHVYAPKNTTDDGQGQATATDSLIRGHAIVYLAYLRLSFTELLGWEVATTEKIRGPLITAMFMGVVDLSTATLLVLAAHMTAFVGGSSMASILGSLLFLAALVLYIHLGAVIPVSIAVSSAEGRWAAPALWLAWRLMKARRKEAGVLTLIACLVPAAICPVYTIAAALSDELLFTFYVWLLGVVFGFFLLPVALQLLSTTAATVFYYHCVEAQVVAHVCDVSVDDRDVVDQV
ncbi:hypothetical protein OsJ_28444 [Oryza sativa Japonica Group]|uniref:Uncharacterized protein n=1 Tax=Oryza sativa subsp. japonica TaxID=39947 RepID=B9G275_ORYSJ|nr:hypothetical protein OsJ_28444 [Oryza sativa Japonica Group]